MQDVEGIQFKGLGRRFVEKPWRSRSPLRTVVAMERRLTGEFYGNHYQELRLDHLVLTDTEYTHTTVGWHYHEHPYFTFLLEGKLFEANTRDEHVLKAGDLLFHHSEDGHRNVKSPAYTRGFHLEVDGDWLAQHYCNVPDCRGSHKLKDPLVVQDINAIFLASKVHDPDRNLRINECLLSAFTSIEKRSWRQDSFPPQWVNRLRERLHATEQHVSLAELGEEFGLHPAYLSRGFRKHVGVTLGQYRKTQRLNKVIALMLSQQYSLTEVGYLCGFYDQSHFITCFRSVFGCTPRTYLMKIGRHSEVPLA